MNYWMTEERRQIARQYVHDMINSFFEDPHGTNYYERYIPPRMYIYAPDIAYFIENMCYKDKYVIKHPKFNMLHDYDHHLYDIEGHRVRLDPNREIVTICVDGVAFDDFEYDELMRPFMGKHRMLLGRFSLPNKYWVQLPPKREQ